MSKEIQKQSPTANWVPLQELVNYIDGKVSRWAIWDWIKIGVVSKSGCIIKLPARRMRGEGWGASATQWFVDPLDLKEFLENRRISPRTTPLSYRDPKQKTTQGATQMATTDDFDTLEPNEFQMPKLELWTRVIECLRLAHEKGELANLEKPQIVRLVREQLEMPQLSSTTILVALKSTKYPYKEPPPVVPVPPPPAVVTVIADDTRPRLDKVEAALKTLTHNVDEAQSDVAQIRALQARLDKAFANTDQVVANVAAGLKGVRLALNELTPRIGDLNTRIDVIDNLVDGPEGVARVDNMVTKALLGFVRTISVLDNRLGAAETTLAQIFKRLEPPPAPPEPEPELPKPPETFMVDVLPPLEPLA